MAQRRGGKRNVAGHHDGNSEFLHRAVYLTLLFIGETEEVRGPERIWMQLAGLPALLDRVAILTRKLVVPRHVNVDHQVERIQLQTTLAGAERLLGAPYGRKEMRVPVVAHRIVGI